MTPNKITFTLTRKKKTSTRFFPRPKTPHPTFLQRWTAAKPTPPAALWIRTSLRHGMEEEGRVDPFPMGFLWVSSGFLQGFIGRLEDTTGRHKNLVREPDEENSRTDLLMKATKGAFCWDKSDSSQFQARSPALILAIQCRANHAVA